MIENKTGYDDQSRGRDGHDRFQPTKGNKIDELPMPRGRFGLIDSIPETPVEVRRNSRSFPLVERFPNFILTGNESGALRAVLDVPRHKRRLRGVEVPIDVLEKDERIAGCAPFGPARAFHRRTPVAIWASLPRSVS
jgi:hypothetical protein